MNTETIARLRKMAAENFHHSPNTSALFNECLDEIERLRAFPSSQAQVREFHERVYGEPSPLQPAMPTLEVRKLRVRLIAEELYELAEAFGLSLAMLGANIEILENEGAEPDLILAADATADLKYIVLGTDVAMGIDGDPVFQEVHRSNMTKFIDGYRREDGKWMKGPSYSPANIAPILEAQSKS